mmetsp:Transcript_16731/g.22567  ORF Transcript_16731/g.22567 Transcript_16731/m.22567 type:complete len:102 (+) Transcript_16731:360-665(+)
MNICQMDADLVDSEVSEKRLELLLLLLCHTRLLLLLLNAFLDLTPRARLLYEAQFFVALLARVIGQVVHHSDLGPFALLDARARHGFLECLRRDEHIIVVL